jgi:hypothetical protein
MKSITKVFGLILMMVFTLSLNAQRGGERGGDRDGKKFDKMIEKAIEKLDLSADQQVKFEQAVSTHKEKLSAIMGNDEMTRKDTKTALKDLQANFNDQVTAMLDKDQNEKWAKMQEKGKERREKRKDRMKERNGAERDSDSIKDSDDNDE